VATFVLIPGGWHGGWTFADFVAQLQRAGHEAYAPTLTGLDASPATSPRDRQSRHPYRRRA